MTTHEKADECMDMFPDRLAEAMKIREWNTNKLAKNMGCQWTTVGTWTKGRKAPNCQHIVWLALTLGVSIDWLLGVSEDGGPEKKEEAT